MKSRPLLLTLIVLTSIVSITFGGCYARFALIPYGNAEAPEIPPPPPGPDPPYPNIVEPVPIVIPSTPPPAPPPHRESGYQRTPSTTGSNRSEGATRSRR